MNCCLYCVSHGQRIPLSARHLIDCPYSQCKCKKCLKVNTEDVKRVIRPTRLATNGIKCEKSDKEVNKLCPKPVVIDHSMQTDSQTTQPLDAVRDLVKELSQFDVSDTDLRTCVLYAVLERNGFSYEETTKKLCSARGLIAESLVSKTFGPKPTHEQPVSCVQIDVPSDDRQRMSSLRPPKAKKSFPSVVRHRNKCENISKTNGIISQKLSTVITRDISVQTNEEIKSKSLSIPSVIPKPMKSFVTTETQTIRSLVSTTTQTNFAIRSPKTPNVSNQPLNITNNCSLSPIAVPVIAHNKRLVSIAPKPLVSEPSTTSDTNQSMTYVLTPVKNFTASPNIQSFQIQTLTSTSNLSQSTSSSRLPLNSTSRLPLNPTPRLPLNSTSRLPLNPTPRLPLNSTSRRPLNSTSRLPLNPNPRLPLTSSAPSLRSWRKPTKTLNLPEPNALNLPRHIALNLPRHNALNLPNPTVVNLPKPTVVNLQKPTVLHMKSMSILSGANTKSVSMNSGSISSYPSISSEKFYSTSDCLSVNNHSMNQSKGCSLPKKVKSDSKVNQLTTNCIQVFNGITNETIMSPFMKTYSKNDSILGLNVSESLHQTNEDIKLCAKIITSEDALAALSTISDTNSNSSNGNIKINRLSEVEECILPDEDSMDSMIMFSTNDLKTHTILLPTNGEKNEIYTKFSSSNDNNPNKDEDFIQID